MTSIGRWCWGVSEFSFTALILSDMMISCYQCALERRLKGDTDLRISGYVQFQDNVRVATNEMAAAITAQALFWSELMLDRPDMQRLITLGLVSRFSLSTLDHLLM